MAVRFCWKFCKRDQIPQNAVLREKWQLDKQVSEKTKQGNMKPYNKIEWMMATIREYQKELVFPFYFKGFDTVNRSRLWEPFKANGNTSVSSPDKKFLQ